MARDDRVLGAYRLRRARLAAPGARRDHRTAGDDGARHARDARGPRARRPARRPRRDRVHVRRLCAGLPRGRAAPPRVAPGHARRHGRWRARRPRVAAPRTARLPAAVLRALCAEHHLLGLDDRRHDRRRRHVLPPRRLARLRRRAGDARRHDRRHGVGYGGQRHDIPRLHRSRRPRRHTAAMNEEIRALQVAMERDGYVAEPAIATAAYLAREMRKPLLVEGEAGVGKTELAKVLARVIGTELIRLQCYEGLDTNTALYEWNYQRQLLRLRIAERETHDPDALEDLIFAREYLLERPLLRAITRTAGPPVLLVDEVDRADDGFEAFLLEVLSDFQVTVPELGTIRATHGPYVVPTSNRTREIGDALRRRCLYLYVEHPGFEKELAILHAKVPGLDDHLARAITRFVQALRRRDLRKLPGVAESIDWAQALVRLGRHRLEPELVRVTLGCLLKDEHDVRVTGDAALTELVAAAGG